MCDILLLAGCGACAFAVFFFCFYFGFGLIFIVLASRAKDAVSTHQPFTKENLSLFPNLCIAIGVFFTLLTILGWTGERKGTKMKLVYAVAQAAVLCLGLYIDFGAYPEKAKAEKNFFEGLNNALKMYGPSQNVSSNAKYNYTEELDYLQENWQCCGTKNYLDWKDFDNSPRVPISCCREEHRMTGCSQFVPFDNPYEANKYIHAQGCMESVISEVLGKMNTLYYFLLPITFVNTLGIITSCCSSGVKKDTDMEEKKVGPLIVRTKSKKKKDSHDVEKGETEDNQDEETENLRPSTELEGVKTV